MSVPAFHHGKGQDVRHSMLGIASRSPAIFEDRLEGRFGRGGAQCQLTRKTTDPENEEVWTA